MVAAAAPGVDAAVVVATVVNSATLTIPATRRLLTTSTPAPRAHRQPKPPLEAPMVQLTHMRRVSVPLILSLPQGAAN